MKNLTVIIVIFLFIQACAQTKENSVVTKDKKPCTKTKTFEVTNVFSKSIDKPEVHFKVEIPECLIFKPAIPGKKNHSYAKVEKYDENNVLQQVVSFGHIKTSDKGKSLEQSSIDFLYQIEKMLKSAGYVFEESELLVKKFDGKEYPIFQGIGELKNNPNLEYRGRSWIKAVIVPNPYGDTNIMFYMLAKDDQNIKHYQDFADKLDISKVWQSFKYISN